VDTATLFVIMCFDCKYYSKIRAERNLDPCLCQDADKFYRNKEGKYILVGCTDSYKEDS